MIDVCITNLGKYNEGTLDYERVTLPATPEVVAQALENIGIDNVRYEEWFLSDWESDKLDCVHDLIGEYSSLEELNYFAGLLEEMDGNELEAFDLVANMEVSSVKEAINLTQCVDDFYPNTEITTYTDLGYYMIEDINGIDLVQLMGQEMSRYFDHEAYGRDLVAGGDVVLSNGGMYSYADIDNSFYDGTLDDIPDEYRLFASVESKGIEYLKNTELGTEENYNNIDGVRNNIKPEKDESKGKPSVLGGLKEGKETAAKHEATPKEHTPPSKNNGLDER